LASNYQCLTYDLRGFGDSQSDGGGYTEPSEPLNSCYTPAAYARDLEILLEKLDISCAWLVGHSLGGTIALWGASQLSDRVKGVVCINAGGGIYLKEEFERFRAVGKQLVKMRPGWLSHLPLADFVFGRDSVARPIGRSWGRQRLRDFVGANPEAALGALLDSTTEAQIHLLPQIVSQLKQPVYFIAGTKDKIMEPKYVLHLASFHWMFQGCGENVLQLPDCGHLAMVEQPDAVASYLQNILKEHT
jgi:pimeloyl-ACP methyl ester carboxylesterase